MRKKIAIVRADNMRPCPMGLPITEACRSVGDAILQMQPLAAVPPEQREKYKKSNRRIYRHEMSGERCRFADKLPETHDAVICDFGDTAAGVPEFPFASSPFYPRVFYTGTLGGPAGLYSFPIQSYTDFSDAQQLFMGIHSIYSTTGVVHIQKTGELQENTQLSDRFYQFPGYLVDEPPTEDKNGTF